MRHKVLTICKLESELVGKYKHELEYLPLSNEETDSSWEELITKYAPRAIIFGLQTIDEAKLSVWRRKEPNQKLKFVRKGTSLHRVDFAAAKKHDIEVLNTPGINAPFVADFIINLLLPYRSSPIAVIGVGDIGKLVTSRLLKDQVEVCLYNRTHYEFDAKGYSYNDSLSEIFSNSRQIVICLPLSDSTLGLITEQHIQSLSVESEIICVSPPRVFSAAAIYALHLRKDIKIVFDHVPSGLSNIHETLKHCNLRAGIVFEEKAAASHECQYAMGEAAIIKALS